MIIYFGNILKGKKPYPTPVSTLAPRFAERYPIVYGSDKTNKLWRLLHMCWLLIKNLKSVKIVLIDTYSSSAFAFAFVISQICRLFNKKYILILHGGNLPALLEKRPFITGMVFKNALAIVSPSHYLKSFFEDKGYSVIFIPNSIPIDQYEFKDRCNVRPRLLLVRAFHEVYNIPMAIEVVRNLKEVFEDVKLCIVGPDKDGSRKKVEEMIAQYSMQNYVDMPGMLTGHEWRDLSADYDIFINTTNFDNMPVSVIEAMALGFPVVSTDAGGLPFLIKNGENGILVKTNDALSMTEAIKKLIDEPGLAESLSCNARNFANTFGWDTVKNQWYSLIENSL